MVDEETSTVLPLVISSSATRPVMPELREAECLDVSGDGVAEVVLIGRP